MSNVAKEGVWSVGGTPLHMDDLFLIAETVVAALIDGAITPSQLSPTTQYYCAEGSKSQDYVGPSYCCGFTEWRISHISTSIEVGVVMRRNQLSKLSLVRISRVSHLSLLLCKNFISTLLHTTHSSSSLHRVQLAASALKAHFVFRFSSRTQF